MRNIKKNQVVSYFLSGVFVGFCSLKLANIFANYFCQKKYSFDNLSNKKPENCEFVNKKITHAHSQILLNADEYITKTIEEDHECSFSLVVLKNKNREINKKWVTFYQASDNPEAVKDMKRITEEHLSKYYAKEQDHEVKIESYDKKPE